MTSLVLASTSAARRAMLDAAGVPYEALAPMVDEDAVKASMAGASPRALADALAELKAVKLSKRVPAAGVLVLGADQVLATADGRMLDKPVDRDDAARQLRTLAGRTHRLLSAAVIAEQGRPVWRVVEEARLAVRPLSDAFIDAYLEAEWPDISGCVGGYKVEGRGAQLFSRIEGSHFAVLGLPLLPLLDYLRTRGVLVS